METPSTINKTWILCISTSFIICIIFLWPLNQGQGSLSFSALQNIATSKISSSSNPSSCSLEVSESKNVSDSKNPEIKEEEEGKCNILDGKWVFDPEGSPDYYASQCPFLSEHVSCQRNGRLDTEYEKWRWQPNGCPKLRFNGKDMLEKLRGKRVIIVGDSLNRNQWESLACLLYSSIPSARVHVEPESGSYKVFKAKDYNCTVEFYWSPFLVELQKGNNRTESTILRLDKLSPFAREWRGADIMVFNTGHWWKHRAKWDIFQYGGKLVQEMDTESAFKMALQTWADWIDQNADATKTRVFFRSISPEHKGEVACDSSTQPLTDESYVYGFPQTMKDIIVSTIRGMKTPVRYLNVTKLSAYRREAHPAIFALTPEKQRLPGSHPDCSHWCLPGVPDTWNTILYAAIVLNSSTEISTTTDLVV